VSAQNSDPGHAIDCGDRNTEAVNLVTNRELSVYIILRGEAQVYFMRGGREREVAVLGEGDVIGDISMLTRMAAVVSVRARGELEVTEITAKEFRSALSDLPAIAEKVINAFVVRRKWLESMDDFSGVLQIVGRKRDAEAFQLRVAMAGLFPALLDSYVYHVK
jgi:CRP-like cAMP-binding protein